MNSYAKPSVVIYDTSLINQIQAQARSCSGGAVGTSCADANVASPDHCTGSGTVGTQISGCGNSKQYCRSSRTSGN